MYLQHEINIFKTKACLVILYKVQPENGLDLFLQLGNNMRHSYRRLSCVAKASHYETPQKEYFPYFTLP